jgi:hypothetical protein
MHDGDAASTQCFANECDISSYLIELLRALSTDKEGLELLQRCSDRRVVANETRPEAGRTVRRREAPMTKFGVRSGQRDDVKPKDPIFVLVPTKLHSTYPGTVTGTVVKGKTIATPLFRHQPQSAPLLRSSRLPPKWTSIERRLLAFACLDKKNDGTRRRAFNCGARTGLLKTLTRLI